MLAAWWLTRIFAHPIEELVALTRTVKAGQYQAKAPVRANDEVGELATAFNEMTEAIEQKEAAREHLLRQVIRTGEDERKRIARELHDQTGQALTSQIATLSALENQCPAEQMRQRLVELREQTEQTLSEVHDLAVALRPSVLDDVGLMAALERHCRLFARRSGVEVSCANLDLDGQRLPAEVELTIYRVVQEALTNGVRHGRAQRLKALVQRTRTGVLVVIRDNGCGFDAREWQKRCAAGNHLGLLGIEERVTLIGGSFCVDSTPGKGASVFADIPLKEAS
jgi:signal transduction histidine kinase